MARQSYVNNFEPEEKMQLPQKTLAGSEHKLDILIVSENRIMFELMEKYLTETLGFIVTISGELNHARELCEHQLHDIILIDWALSHLDGVAQLAEMAEVFENTKVVVMSGQLDKAMAQALFQAGVCGAIDSAIPLRALESVIKLIASGQIYFPHNTKVEPLESASTSVDMTEIEVAVIKSASRGLKNKEIACRYGLSEVSVKMHMRNICSKLGTRNRAHAAMVGRELGII